MIEDIGNICILDDDKGNDDDGDDDDGGDDDDEDDDDVMVRMIIKMMTMVMRMVVIENIGKIASLMIGIVTKMKSLASTNLISIL